MWCARQGAAGSPARRKGPFQQVAEKATHGDGVVDVGVQAVKVVFVANAAAGHLQDEEATLVQCGRDGPVVITEDDEVPVVDRRKGIVALALACADGVGDARLQHGLVALVAAPHSLVDDQDVLVAKMGVELAKQMMLLRRLEGVGTEEGVENPAYGRLARAFLAE